MARHSNHRAKASIEKATDTIRGKVKLAGLSGGLVLLCVGGLFGLWFAGSISGPIMRLRDGVRQMGQGNFTVEVTERGAAEVRQLAQSFNRLGNQLTEYIARRDFLRDTFGRYLTL